MTLILPAKKHNSNCQEMGETREPMARDCVQDALRLANLYEHVGEDFWICFASKAHATIPNACVHGWEVVFARPPCAIPGMLVWYVNHKTKEMTLDPTLSLPYDVPLDESQLSTNPKDFTPSLAETAKKSNSILLA